MLYLLFIAFLVLVVLTAIKRTKAVINFFRDVLGKDKLD